MLIIFLIPASQIGDFATCLMYTTHTHKSETVSSWVIAMQNITICASGFIPPFFLFLRLNNFVR